MPAAPALASRLAQGLDLGRCEVLARSDLAVAPPRRRLGRLTDNPKLSELGITGVPPKFVLAAGYVGLWRSKVKLPRYFW
jgi:hypothetical protein